MNTEEARYILITQINTNKITRNEYNFEYKKILKNIVFTDKRTNIDLDKYQVEIGNYIYNFGINESLDGQHFVTVSRKQL